MNTQALTMPTKASKQWESLHEQNLRQMREGLKDRGIRKSQRPKLIAVAASGRPADLAEQARAALADRRAKLVASKQADTSPEMRRVLAELAGRQV